MTSPGPVEVPGGYMVAGWRVTGPLGSGGWGSVYAAEAVGDGEPRQVALKFLPPAVLAPGQRALLADVVARETEFSLRADHPCLIRTLAVHTVRDADRPGLDGAVVLVMERAAGNLSGLLAEAVRGEPVPGYAGMLEQICGALAAMRAQGWVHGDLKPSNVLLMEDGSARLADFGVTAHLDGTHAYVPRIGSSDYLPPEWWSERVGEQGVPVRATADIWAFGVLAHQVLTGGLHPFAGTTQQARALAAQTYANGAAPLRLDERLPPEWRRLIADCLAPDHGSRAHLDAASLADRIAGLRESRAPVPAEGAARSRRVPALAAVAAVVAIAVLAAVLAAVFARGPAGSPPPAAGSGSPAVPAGSLRPDAAVPARYRGVITTAAQLCASRRVTPALIAGILKAESDFNPRFSDPATASYGIAGWTPAVFTSWVSDAGQDYMKPADAIPAVSRFLCWLDEKFDQANLGGDRQALLAAGYDTSSKKVIEQRGVPPTARTFAAAVVRYAHEYGTP